jgi:hypothetical protein
VSMIVKAARCRRASLVEPAAMTQITLTDDIPDPYGR